jgi:hypothetical protein
LIDGDDLDRRKFLDLFQRQFERPIDLSLDLQRECIGIDVERHVSQVIADEKCVVRRDDALIEDRERRLQLRRPAGQPDHRPLLRVFDQRPFAIVERQCHRIERERLDGIKAGRGAKCCQPGAFDDLASIEHGASSEACFVEAGHHRTQ